jgi:hypothetical protein
MIKSLHTNTVRRGGFFASHIDSFSGRGRALPPLSSPCVRRCLNAPLRPRSSFSSPSVSSLTHIIIRSVGSLTQTSRYPLVNLIVITTKMTQVEEVWQAGNFQFRDMAGINLRMKIEKLKTDARIHLIEPYRGYTHEEWDNLAQELVDHFCKVWDSVFSEFIPKFIEWVRQMRD